MKGPRGFVICKSDDSKDSIALALSDLLKVGTVKIDNRLYCNVTKENFNVSLVLSVRNGVKLNRATLKTEVVDISEYSVQEHRKTLELCNEIAVLSPESENLIRCFGFVGREDESDNFQFITKVSEETVFRFDQYMQRLELNTFWDSVDHLIGNLWNAHDHLHRLGYFPDVDIDNIYVAADWSFKFDCDRVLPLHTVTDDFEWILARRFTFLDRMDAMQLSPKAVPIIRSILPSHKYDFVFGRRPDTNNDAYRLKLFKTLQENEMNGMELEDLSDSRQSVYNALKLEFIERLKAYLNCASVDYVSPEKLDLRSLSKIKKDTASFMPDLRSIDSVDMCIFGNPDLLYAAVEEVVEHNRKWKKTPNEEDFMEMMLDACVIRLIPLVDADIKARCYSADGDSSYGKWSELPAKDIVILYDALIVRQCVDVVEFRVL